MTLSLMGRWTLAFWLESLLIGICLVLLGFMTAGFGPLLSFCLIASSLLMFGSWLYHGGGGRFLLHLLLYPIVFAVGIASYSFYESWFIAIILAAVYFWRVQSAASDGYGKDSLLRRFVLAMMACLIQLVIAALYTSVMDPASFSPEASYAMLALLTGSYTLIMILSFIIREESLSTRLSARISWLLTGQLLGTRLLLIGGYLLVGSLVLGILNGIWTWLKGPVGSGLYMLIEPVLKKMLDLIAILAGKMSQKQSGIDVFLNDLGNQAKQPPKELPLGEPLYATLEPYLLAGFILIAVLLLGRYIWKKRFKGTATLANTAAAAHNNVLTPVVIENKENVETDASQWFKKPVGLEDDPTRYAYYQFLVLMEKQGMAIELHETPQEYLRRLQEQSLLDQAQLNTIVRITRYYQQYRYQEQSLLDADLIAMQQAVEQLGSTFPEL